MVGSSILPVAIRPWDHQLVFLFGKENPLEKSAKGWSDFGGGMEGNETPWQTALREGQEEMTGVLGPIHLLVSNRAASRRAKKHPPWPHVLYLGDPKNYHVHVVPIKYSHDLPQHFQHMHSFVWQRMGPRTLGPTKIFEKCQLQWFTLHEIQTRIREFRHFYQSILKTHILPHASKIKKMCLEKFPRTQHPSIRRHPRRKSYFFRSNNRTRKNKN